MILLRRVVPSALPALLFFSGVLTAQAAMGPTFVVSDAELGKHVSVIIYGDMRFHDPSNSTVANPMARKLLVDEIARQKPSALQLTGDVPYKGSDPADYQTFRAETGPWRAAGLRVYPALGNHELSGGAEQGIQNWWTAFSELRGKRWYSAALGSRIYLVELDSTSDLSDASEQRAWVDEQLKNLPRAVDFVLIGLHHPPVADIQTRFEVDHNPRPNEIALRDYLTRTRPLIHAELLVTAGHIHNYERATVAGVTYLVSGGGGARPYEVDRTAQDLYQDKDFPNFHYVRLELKKSELTATMYRLVDPSAPNPVFQEKDHFTLRKR